jgi:hypothetical protein
LGQDPLYALPEQVIDAISSALPDFFSREDLRFERDLAKTASFGFFHRNRSPHGKQIWGG